MGGLLGGLVLFVQIAIYNGVMGLALLLRAGIHVLANPVAYLVAAMVGSALLYVITMYGVAPALNPEIVQFTRRAPFFVGTTCCSVPPSEPSCPGGAHPTGTLPMSRPSAQEFTVSRLKLRGVRPIPLQRSLAVVYLAVFLLAGCTAGSGENDFVTLPVGAALPSGEECAARVHRDQREPRPENTSANQIIADRVSMPVWKDFTEQANRQFVPRIDGKFIGTTGEILTWGACKGGLDADLAVATSARPTAAARLRASPSSPRTTRVR